jgi:microcystin-dependent protein
MADCYLGEIRLFAGPRIPADWVPCDGRALSVNAYQALFSLIGKTYGGDGITSFNIPDLRGLLACGIGQRTGSSNNYVLGQSFGAFTVELTEATMPTHTHAMQACTTEATGLNPALGLYAASPTNYASFVPASVPGFTTANLAANLLTSEGGNGPHDNVMPSMGLNYIIATQGIYPTSN